MQKLSTYFWIYILAWLSVVRIRVGWWLGLSHFFCSYLNSYSTDKCPTNYCHVLDTNFCRWYSTTLPVINCSTSSVQKNRSLIITIPSFKSPFVAKILKGYPIDNLYRICLVWPHKLCNSKVQDSLLLLNYLSPDSLFFFSYQSLLYE